jgi:hypothetical protein
MRRTALPLLACLSALGVNSRAAEPAKIELALLKTVTVTGEQFLLGSKDGRPVTAATELRLPTAWATIGLAGAAEEDLASQPPASAADPFVGTYVFNPAKSTMSGAPATAEMVLAISDEGDHLVIIPSGKTIDGASLTGRLIVPKAGGTVPAPPGTVAYDLAVITRPNPNAIQVVRMRQGKELVRIRLELTPDGKTLTRSIRATNPQDEPIEGISVLERQ